MRALHIACIVLLVACIITLSAVWGTRNVGPDTAGSEITRVGVRDAVSRSAEHAYILHGYVDQPANAKLEPDVIFGAYVDGVFTGLELSTTWSGLYVPSNKHSHVTLEFDLHSIVNCGDLTDVHSSKRRLVFERVPLAKTVPPSANVAVPMLGLGASKVKGEFVSPILAAMQKASMPLQWAFSQQFGYVAITLQKPVGPCFAYCWVPLTITSAGEYYIDLIPTAAAPYKRAMLAFGRWLSLMPSGASSKNEMLTLKATSCEIILRSDTYIRGPPGMPADQCVLGASVGLQNALFVVDIAKRRVGIVTVIS